MIKLLRDRGGELPLAFDFPRLWIFRVVSPLTTRESFQKYLAVKFFAIIYAHTRDTHALARLNANFATGA